MRSWIKNIALICAAATLFACSDGNSGAPLVDNKGKHPDSWLETHWIAYRSGLPQGGATFDSPCIECHGKDLSGGIAGVGCFTPLSADGRACHANQLGHPDNWGSPAQHGVAAKAAPGVSSGFAYCARCHGSDYRGGSGKAVSCFSCHATAPHPPRPWSGSAPGGRSHTLSDVGTAAECAKCHLSPSPGSVTPGCFNNTMCHGTAEQIGHASGWLDPTSAGFHAKQLNNSCTGCHGLDLNGSGSAPSCLSATPIGGMTCHATAPPTISPTGASRCLSCHGGASAGPTGTQAPNRQFGHGEHSALASVVPAVGTCALCHSGAGSGTANHGRASQNGGRAQATVAFADSTFALEGATLSFDPATRSCSGVSCHGGKTTPGWDTGAFDTYSNAGCPQCHEAAAGDPQAPGSTAPYNSYWSGKQSVIFSGKNMHDFHLQSSLGTPAVASCTDCHSSTLLRTMHFNGLHLQNLALRGAGTRPADTIGGTGTSVLSYDRASQGSCSNSCHDTRSWF